jgi:hypothetical protein
MAPPAYVTEELKQKTAATILAESWEGQEEDIRWMYLNRITKEKGLKGLEGSTAYKQEGIWYKIWLYMLGDKAYAKDALPNHKNFKGFATVEDFCENNDWMKKVAAKRAEKVKKLVDDMFTSTNPYAGWIGQGNISDINRGETYWKSARQYYWLQEAGTVTDQYVKVLKAGNNTQFIFDANSIQKYFEKNPLPKQVKKYAP